MHQNLKNRDEFQEIDRELGTKYKKKIKKEGKDKKK